ncbi:MAG: hypothetical protein ACJ76H_08470, partial [Bacteriovoracaceae bacterium]
GIKDYENYFGHFLHNLTELNRDNRKNFDWKTIRDLYSKIHYANEKKILSSVHDISEGGMLVALFETLMMDKLGTALSVPEEVNETAWLYSELPGHFVVSVDRKNKEAFEHHFPSTLREFLGETDNSGRIRVSGEELSTHELTKAWRNE